VDALAARRPLLRLAALLREVGVPGTLALMERLRYSNAAIQEVAGLVSASGGRRLPLPSEDAPAADIRRWLSRVEPARFPALVRIAVAGVRALDDRGDRAGRAASRRPTGCGVEREAEVLLLRWRRIRAELRSAPPLRVEDLALDGRDLIRMGYKPGPHFGRVLRALLEVVLDDPSRNDAETLADIVRERLEDENGRDPSGRSRRGEG
jgi:tRNA nucleotidyltransferase (CCA-adding enzyme)